MLSKEGEKEEEKVFTPTCYQQTWANPRAPVQTPMFQIHIFRNALTTHRRFTEILDLVFIFTFPSQVRLSDATTPKYLQLMNLIVKSTFLSLTNATFITSN